MKNKTINDLFVLNFVQKVSSPQTHAKRLSCLRKMMKNCPNDLTITQWMQLWRGLYYIVWYEEMQKGGEELIIMMGSYDNQSFQMSGFKALTESWNGIDAFRIDKYMFLIRHMLRNCLQKQIEAIIDDRQLFQDEIFMKNYRKNIYNDIKSMEIKADVIDYIISITSKSIGLFLHICDIYLDELKLIINEQLSIDEMKRSTIYYELIIPFIKLFTLINDDRLLKSMMNNIFINHLFDDILIDENFLVRKLLIKNLYESILNLNLDDLNTTSTSTTTTTSFNNYRIKILDYYQQKLNEFDGKTVKKIKRKVIGLCRKTKRAKYEMITKTPFVRSIIPLPMM